MSLPSDPFILLSVVNTQLRDRFDSLDELCSSLGEDREAIEKKLHDAGFDYNEELNQFR